MVKHQFGKHAQRDPRGMPHLPRLYFDQYITVQKLGQAARIAAGMRGSTPLDVTVRLVWKGETLPQHQSISLLMKRRPDDNFDFASMFRHKCNSAGNCSEKAWRMPPLSPIVPFVVIRRLGTMDGVAPTTPLPRTGMERHTIGNMR